MEALAGSVAKEGDAAVVAVQRGLEDAVWSVRLLAAELAGRVRRKEVLPLLASALADERERVVGRAGRSLVELTGIPFDPVPGRWKAWLQTDAGRGFDPALVTPIAPAAWNGDAGGRTVAPVKFHDLPITSRHVGFVLDVSGSMREPVPGRTDGATRWDVAKEQLRGVLERLSEAEGNVWCFANAVDAAFPSAVRMGAARRAELSRWLDAREPRGYTALYDGIAAALAEPSLDTVVVLSDGVPSTGSFFTKTDLLTELRRLNRRRKARIDVVCVGSEGIAKKWRDVLETLTTESGGMLLRK
jgi:hypothetical protein